VQFKFEVSMEPFMERRGRWIWYAYGACVVLFLAIAPFYGRVGLAIGVMGTAFGFERLVSNWDQKRKWRSVLFLAWLGIGVLAMMLPIWSQTALDPDDRKHVADRHHYHLWERDHLR
jgi:hypothetical protein